MIIKTHIFRNVLLDHEDVISGIRSHLPAEWVLRNPECVFNITKICPCNVYPLNPTFI